MTTKTPFIAIFVLMAAMLIVPGCEALEEAVEPENDVDAQNELTGKRVAILITEGFHDAETLDPKEYLADRGASVTVIGPEVATVGAYNSDVEVDIEKAVADVSIDDFDALVIPGGQSPDNLRQYDEVVDFARDFFNTGKPVAAICHGPQVLVTAGVLEQRTATCFGDMSYELKEAGAEYVDEELVIDGNLITSRVPDDLPVFSEAIADVLKN